MIHETTTPSGLSIAFEDGQPDPETGNAKRRGYKIDGKVYPSVTTVLGVIDKSGPLMAWAVKETQEGRDYRETRDTAATRGTSVHAALEVLATDGTPPSLGDFPEEDRGYVRGLCAWWLDHSPVAKHVEIPLASVEYQFAGKPDLVCDIQGISHLVDLKTSKRVYETHHLQTVAYALALEECGYDPVTCPAILRVGEDGTYEFVPANADEQDFLVVREMYEVLKRVRRKPKAATSEAVAA